MLAMPKSTMVMYGLARDALLFLDQPKESPLLDQSQTMENWAGFVCQVVLCQIDRLSKELKWLVPGDHQWNITWLYASSFHVRISLKDGFGKSS
jgi:hypothetical protein